MYLETCFAKMKKPGRYLFGYQTCGNSYFPFQPIIFIFLFSSRDFSQSFSFQEQGAQARCVVDTFANEAIPQWGMHDLISHVYFQFKYMVMKQCCGCPPFVFLLAQLSCCFLIHYMESRDQDKALTALQMLNLSVCVQCLGSGLKRNGFQEDGLVYMVV